MLTFIVGVVLGGALVYFRSHLRSLGERILAKVAGQ